MKHLDLTDQYKKLRQRKCLLPILLFFFFLSNHPKAISNNQEHKSLEQIAQVSEEITSLQKKNKLLENRIIALEKKGKAKEKQKDSVEKFSTSWVPILSLLIALTTIYFGWRTILYNRKVKRFEIILNVTTEYASQEMLDSILMIRNWEKKYRNDESKFDEAFGQMRRTNYASIREIDLARRKIAHFFYKIYLLHENQVITLLETKNIVSIDQLNLLDELIEPLEASISDKYNKNMFLFFREVRKII